MSFPCHAAAVHIAKMAANRCWTPRRARGSTTEAKQPSRSPPLAACRLTACATSSSNAASAAGVDTAGMPDSHGNGASRDKRSSTIPVLAGLRCRSPQRHALTPQRDQPEIIPTPTLAITPPPAITRPMTRTWQSLEPPPGHPRPSRLAAQHSTIKSYRSHITLTSTNDFACHPGHAFEGCSADRTWSCIWTRIGKLRFLVRDRNIGRSLAHYVPMGLRPMEKRGGKKVM